MEYDLSKAINSLKTEKDTAVVTHFFQNNDIKMCSDFVGDSLSMAEFVKKCNQQKVVVCAPKHIGETCKIFAPDKKILLPLEIDFSTLDEMITKESLEQFKLCLPNAPVLTHINSQASVKSVSDYCCTTENILNIVDKIPSDTIIFTPDANIGAWVQSNVDKRIIFWDGYCHVHNRVLIEDIIRLKAVYEDAFVISHPECRLEVTDISDMVCSVNCLLEKIKTVKADNIIIATEKCMLETLNTHYPSKNFILASHKLFCKNMVKINLENLFETIELEENVINLDIEMIENAKKSVNSMYNLLK